MLFDAFTRMRKSEYVFDELYESHDKSTVEDTVKELLTLLDSLNTQLLDQDTEGNPDLKDRLDGFRRMVGRAREELTELFFTDEPNYFRWCEKPSGSKFLSIAIFTSAQ